MATKNPHRIELGEMLKKYRVRAGLTSQDVEAELHWGAGKTTRVEAGSRIVAHAEVVQLAELYKLDEDKRATLHLLADSARRRESSARVADFGRTYITLERAANEIDYYDTELIHSLVQTERYAHAVLATGFDQVDEQVHDRLARRAVLTAENAPRVRILLGEEMLHRLVGGREVMREQLEHLLEVCNLPNVSIRILPFAVGAHRALGVGFTIVRLTSPTITRVYIEGLTDATYIQGPDETAIYAAGFEQIWDLAAGDAESATILRRDINT